jgi:uncharacterized protein
VYRKSEARQVDTSAPQVIDAHAHLGPREVGAEYDYMRGLLPARELIRSMDAIGITKAAVWAMRQLGDYASANRFLLQEGNKYPSRIIPFVRMNPWSKDSARQLQKYVAQGAKGVKLHPADENFSPDEKFVHPLMEIAEKARIPVAVHTGNGNARPSIVGELADRFPRVKVILLHLDNYYDSTFVARKCDNVYLETSQCLYLHRIMKIVVGKIGPERIVWGSDFPYHHQEIERRKIELAGLGDDELRMILGENFLRILGN